MAEWRWVDDGQNRSETYIYEERREPVQRDYYDQRPQTYYRREEYRPVVTEREVFREGRCEVTRTYLSDGSSYDDRVCTRLLLPHEFIIDRVGRHFDRLRGY